LRPKWSDSDAQPILNVAYMFTDHISAELGLGTPYTHDMYGAGAQAAAKMAELDRLRYAIQAALEGESALFLIDAVMRTVAAGQPVMLLQPSPQFKLDLDKARDAFPYDEIWYRVSRHNERHLKHAIEVVLNYLLKAKT